MTCGKLFFLFAFFYISLLVYQTSISSKPVEECVEKKDTNDKKCVNPLLFQPNSSLVKNDEDLYQISSSFLSLELWIVNVVKNDDDNNNKKMPWKWKWELLTSCTPSNMNFTIYDADNIHKQQSLKIKGEQDNCYLTMPQYNRQRGTTPNQIKPLVGKFILQQITTFQKSESSSTSTSSSSSTSIQKLSHDKRVQDEQNIITETRQIAETTFEMTRMIQQQNGNKMEYVSHFKYYRQPILIRIGIDQQLYSIQQPFRGDGYRLDVVKQQKRQQQQQQQQGSGQFQYFYRPSFYVDDLALRHSSQIELAPPNITDTNKSSNHEGIHHQRNNKNSKPPIPMNIKITFQSPIKHTILNQLNQAFQLAETFLSHHELDELRYFIEDEYIFRFILTQIISILHLVLDYLAFSDEIKFYVGKKKDRIGISVSSLYSRFICDLIIFLYLADGNHTSWLILVSVGAGVVVSGWKLYKFGLSKITHNNQEEVDTCSSSDKNSIEKKLAKNVTTSALSKREEKENLTQEYDKIARTYLGFVLYPLVIGSALYAKQFYYYKSWYSWIISNLANAVYTFGFISLCPQLYINYRLKSVAHLPWKVFVYKIFNTFVDDVFAFIIEMPLKHKIMTLRDDVVFVVFLYQAYIYRIDSSRTNEFGYAYDDNKNKDNHADCKDAVVNKDDTLLHEKNAHVEHIKED